MTNRCSTQTERNSQMDKKVFFKTNRSMRRVGRNGEKLRPARALHLRLVHQPRVGFVDQRSRLQGVVPPLANVGGRKTAQLPVDERRQFAQCLLVAAAPGLEQSRYIPGSGCAIQQAQRDCTPPCHWDVSNLAHFETSRTRRRALPAFLRKRDFS